VANTVTSNDTTQAAASSTAASSSSNGTVSYATVALLVIMIAFIVGITCLILGVGVGFGLAIQKTPSKYLVPVELDFKPATAQHEQQ